MLVTGYSPFRERSVNRDRSRDLDLLSFLLSCKTFMRVLALYTKKDLSPFDFAADAYPHALYLF